MRRLVLGSVFIIALPLAACVQNAETNPFLTFTETFSTAQQSNNNNNGGNGSGGVADDQFRRDVTLTLANNHTEADLDVSVAAWVSPASIRSAEQQDALLRAGYSQITSEIKLGSVFTLVPGTFVLNGPGLAGAQRFVVKSGATAGITTVTPDVILVFAQPPVGCDSVAFKFEIDGEVIEGDPLAGDIFGGSTNVGGRKTFSQINVYQCEPLNPGLFLKIGGGGRKSNEFLEGENIRFDFNEVPDGRGDFGIVTIGG